MSCTNRRQIVTAGGCTVSAPESEQCAAVDWMGCKSRTEQGIPCRLVVRRTRPAPGSRLALLAGYSYHAFITDCGGDPVELDAWHWPHISVGTLVKAG